MPSITVQRRIHYRIIYMFAYLCKISQQTEKLSLYTYPCVVAVVVGAIAWCAQYYVPVHTFVSYFTHDIYLPRIERCINIVMNIPLCEYYIIVLFPSSLFYFT